MVYLGSKQARLAKAGSRREGVHQEVRKLRRGCLTSREHEAFQSFGFYSRSVAKSLGLWEFLSGHRTGFLWNSSGCWVEMHSHEAWAEAVSTAGTCGDRALNQGRGKRRWGHVDGFVTFWGKW